MPLYTRCSRLVLILLLVAHTVPAQENADETSLDYILDRYVDSMGGRVELQKLMSVRLMGDIVYADGTQHAITVLKKKPNLVRIIVDTGVMRIIQGYDGKVAWFSRERGRNQIIDRMRGNLETTFIRDAPLENVLVKTWDTGAELALGDEITIAGTSCHQIIAHYPDGAKVIHCIEKETYLERRIYQYDTNGKLLSELVPSDFELIDGVLFAMKTTRMEADKQISTLTIRDVQTNLGILDAAFSPPEELPEK